MSDTKYRVWCAFAAVTHGSVAAWLIAHDDVAHVALGGALSGAAAVWAWRVAFGARS